MWKNLFIIKIFFIRTASCNADFCTFVKQISIVWFISFSFIIITVDSLFSLYQLSIEVLSLNKNYWTILFYLCCSILIYPHTTLTYPLFIWVYLSLILAYRYHTTLSKEYRLIQDGNIFLNCILILSCLIRFRMISLTYSMIIG